MMDHGLHHLENHGLYRHHHGPNHPNQQNQLLYHSKNKYLNQPKLSTSELTVKSVSSVSTATSSSSSSSFSTSDLEDDDRNPLKRKGGRRLIEKKREEGNDEDDEKTETNPDGEDKKEEHYILSINYRWNRNI